jgi:hypothetical protein
VKKRAKQRNPRRDANKYEPGIKYAARDIRSHVGQVWNVIPFVGGRELVCYLEWRDDHVEARPLGAFGVPFGLRSVERLVSRLADNYRLPTVVDSHPHHEIFKSKVGWIGDAEATDPIFTSDLARAFDEIDREDRGLPPRKPIPAETPVENMRSWFVDCLDVEGRGIAITAIDKFLRIEKSEDMKFAMACLESLRAL